MSKSIHRCERCNHQSEDHSKGQGFGGGYKPRVGPCSMGGCECALTVDQVDAMFPEVTVPTFPAYDAASGRWSA